MPPSLPRPLCLRPHRGPCPLCATTPRPMPPPAHSLCPQESCREDIDIDELTRRGRPDGRVLCPIPGCTHAYSARQIAVLDNPADEGGDGDNGGEAPGTAFALYLRLRMRLQEQAVLGRAAAQVSGAAAMAARACHCPRSSTCVTCPLARRSVLTPRAAGHGPRRPVGRAGGGGDQGDERTARGRQRGRQGASGPDAPRAAAQAADAQRAAVRQLRLWPDRPPPL